MYCSYEEVAKAMNDETERREVWKDRCEHSSEVDVCPMDCNDEVEYKYRVKDAYHKKWSSKYDPKELPDELFFMDRYETEEEFLQEKERLERHYNQYKTYRDCGLKKKDIVSMYIKKMEDLVQKDMDLYGYDVSHISKEDMDRLEMKVKSIDSFRYISLDTLKERISMLQVNQSTISPLPSPTPEQNSQNEPNDPAEPGPETSDTAVSEPKPVKTEFIVPPIGYGKIYTMQRGNKKSKLTLTKRM